MSKTSKEQDSSRTQQTQQTRMESEDLLESQNVSTLRATDLTLDDKLTLVSGQTLWLLGQIRDLPSLTVADGPHGVRKPVRELALHDSFPATCFPTAAALACSWDTDLMRTIGKMLSVESQHFNVAVLLGPGLNLKRHACGGRNFEYFSEDPYLSGKLASAYINGVQASGKVAACAKHFAVNNQESHRFVVDAVVDERTARELYFRGFEIAVNESNPATMMCAYNSLNGVYCSENKFINTDILRTEWNYKGLIMTDWGACNSRIEGLKAGMDLEMPGSMGAHNRSIRKAIKDGELDEATLDICAQRVLELIQQYQDSVAAEVSVDWTSHHKEAKHAAMDCAVLLQNKGNLLPLKSGSRVAVIGDFARDHPRYQGMGSSRVLSDSVVTAYEEMKRWTDTMFFARGYEADDEHLEEVHDELIQEAVHAAKQADVALLFVGLPEIMESEGFDREHMHIPAQHNALIEAVYAVNPNVVVILSNGGSIELPWADKVPAILEGYLLGEASGAAMVDLIFGAQSPCGKLAETFPLSKEDALVDQYFPGTRDRVEHREGLDVGYRYFDTVQKPVRFPFGHGLTYTTFEYSDLQVIVAEDEQKHKAVNIQFRLENTGAVTSKEIVQCYVHQDYSTVYRPDQELVAFTKVLLKPGESNLVTLVLDTRSFSTYDIGVSDWVVEAGSYEIRVGSSSRDVRLREHISFSTGSSPSTEARESYPPLQRGSSDTGVTDDTFAARFGRSRKERVLEEIHSRSVESAPSCGGIVGFHRNSLIKEIAARRILGKILFFFVYKQAVKDIDKGAARRRQKRMVKATVEHLPLRALVLFSSGALSFEMLDAVISSMNFRVFKAMKEFAIAFACLCRKN